MVQLPLHNALVIYQCTASGSLLSFLDFQTTIISSVLIITQTCQTGEEGRRKGGGEQNCSFCPVHPKLEGKTRKGVSLMRHWECWRDGKGEGCWRRSWGCTAGPGGPCWRGHIALVSKPGRVSRHLFFLGRISVCRFNENHLSKPAI